MISPGSAEIDRFESESGKTIVKVAGACGRKEQAVREAELAKRYGYDAVLLSPGGLNDLPGLPGIHRQAGMPQC